MPPERRLPAPRRRARLSVTSLIDVIFLLLLFFMLTSTFSRYSELELTAARGGGGEAESRPVFLQLGSEALTLNGQGLSLEELTARLAEIAPDEEERQMIVALREGVTSQRLTDLLVVLRGLPSLSVTVLD